MPPPSRNHHDDHDDPTVQRTVPAGTAKRPATTAPNSVFDAGRQAKAAATVPRPRMPLIDLAKVEIHKGVPLPVAQTGSPTGYATLLERMQPGDSVQLPSRQAYSLYAAAKKLVSTKGGTLKFAMRKLDDTTHGVWRTA